MNDGFEIRLFRSLKRHFAMILIIAVVLAAALGFYKYMTRKISYSATATLAVTDTEERSDNYLQTSKDPMLVGFFSRLATSSTTIEMALQDSGLDLKPLEANDMLTITSVPSSLYLDITVEAPDADTASGLALAMAEALEKNGEDLQGQDILTIISYPENMVVKNVSGFGKYIAAGFAAGALLAWFAFYMIDSAKAAKDTVAAGGDTAAADK